MIGTIRRGAFASGLLALAAAGLIAGAAQAAPNDFEVIASNAAAVKVGDKFEKGARLVLPAGSAVTLADRTGAAIKTRDCGGAYNGPVELCTATAGSGPAPAVGGGTRGIAK